MTFYSDGHTCLNPKLVLYIRPSAMQNTGTYSEAQTGSPIHLIDSPVPFTASSGRYLSMPDAEREDHAAERAAYLAG